MDYEIEDKAGNKKECNGVKANVYIDKTAPSKPTTMEFSYSDWSRYTQGTWTKLKIYAANTKTSKGPSGATDAHSQVAKYQISKDNNNWVDYSYSSSKEMYYMDTSGINTRYFRACDTVGNCGESISRIAKIDKDAPSCSISGNPTSWQKTDATLTGNSIDSNGTVYYSWDNKNNYSTIIKTKTVSSNGTYTLYVKDQVGNETNCSETVTKIDKDAPSCSISISGTNFVATYSDTGGSLVNSSSSSSTTQEITSAGTYTFTVYDNATNSGSCSATVTNLSVTDTHATMDTINQSVAAIGNDSRRVKYAGTIGLDSGSSGSTLVELSLLSDNLTITPLSDTATQAINSVADSTKKVPTMKINMEWGTF